MIHGRKQYCQIIITLEKNTGFVALDFFPNKLKIILERGFQGSINAASPAHHLQEA